MQRILSDARNHTQLVFFFCLLVLICIAVGQSGFGYAASQTLSGGAVLEPVDPNKGPSELNHHLAGWALVGIGLLQLASLSSPRLKPQSYIWPSLFLIAGLFLALWSDGEIWPRGNLNWSWLLHHDAEARQHKIYALLLIAIGIVEYLRILAVLPRFWKTWAFPVLAVIGAGLLLIHDHTKGSGARSPEAQHYLINPALDVDGKPRMLNSVAMSTEPMDDHTKNMQQSSEHDMHSSADLMPMDHSHMSMGDSPATEVHTSHRHVMTASMIRVEHEHMWFLVVGVAIGLFKFLSDGEFFRSRSVAYLWPSCMVLLGLMLVFYRE